MAWRRIVRQCANQSAKLNEITYIKRFTQLDLDQFSKLTGDHNPVHSTRQPPHEPKVHGAFLNAVVAGIIGTQLPGPGTVVLEQSFQFPKPCRIEKDTEVSVNLLKRRKISIVSFVCRQDGIVVFQGEAKVLLAKE